jgi:hypothetical protein
VPVSQELPESFVSGMSTQDQSHYRKNNSAERRNPIPIKLVYTQIRVRIDLD